MGKINADSREVSYLLSKNNFYIPSYQRGYSWEKGTAEQLANDLFDHLENNPGDDYFVGNIVVYYGDSRDLRNHLVVVDGQQRITTFMLMATALRISSFSSNLLEADEKKKIEDELIKLVIEEKSRDEKETRIKLFSNRSEIVAEIINCKLENTNLAKDRWLSNIRKKYEKTNYFKNLELFVTIFNRKLTDYSSYKEFIDLFGRIVFVMIDIGDEKGVHKIFENINSKGIDLTLTDLVKNYLYILLEMRSNITDKQILENEISEIFEIKIEELKNTNVNLITNYLIYLEEKYFNKDKTKEVYSHFQKHINSKIKENKISLEKIISELKEQINLISYFENYEKANSSNLYDVSVFMNKNTLTSVIFPIIYKVAKMLEIFNENGEVVINGEFEDFIILMDKYITRRYIVNYSNKNLNKNTPEILKKLTELGEYNIESVEEILTNNESEKNGSLMPTKQEMLRIFSSETCPYETKTSKEIKQIMFRINYFITQNSSEGIALTDEEYKKFTVEHVMPQRPKQDSNWLKELSDRVGEKSLEERNDIYKAWSQNWGNLTITQDNSKLSNDDFEEKLEIFSSSTLRINQYIANCKKWDIVEIENRKSKLIDILDKHF